MSSTTLVPLPSNSSSPTSSPDSSHPLDIWNYIFYSIELVLNICFIISYPIISYICIRLKTIHINFRILLQLANTGYLLSNIQRTILLIQRFCCIGNANTDFVIHLTYLLMFGGYLFTGAWFCLVMERVYASWHSGSYEKRCKSISHTIFIMGAALLPATVFFSLKFLNIAGILDYFIMFFEFFIDIITAIALFYILYYNRKVYDGRHNANLALSGRYQLTENIRATSYIIPVAICDFSGRVILAGLITYSVFFTDIPLGQDSSHLSHAYDLNSAARRVFFACWLIFKSEVLFSSRKIAVQMDTAESRRKHFDELKKQWE